MSLLFIAAFMVQEQRTTVTTTRRAYFAELGLFFGTRFFLFLTKN